MEMGILLAVHRFAHRISVRRSNILDADDGYKVIAVRPIGFGDTTGSY